MAVQLWKDKARKLIDPELFSAQADSLAQEINQERMRNDKLNKPTQIRKFYDEVVRYQTMVQNSPEEFAEVLPYVKMLNAKAAYAMGRELIGERFKTFVADSLKQVQDYKDFELFCTFFEAFMGFYKYHVEKGSGGFNGRNQGGQRR